MLVNSSSSLSICQPPLDFVDCLICTTGLEAFSAYTVTNVVVVLPLSVLIIYVGVQQWRQQRTNSAAARRRSPSDLFTFHAVCIETLSLIGDINYCVGNYIGNLTLIKVGFFLLCIVLPGQDLFHCLTCMERYLAVIHPIAYLRLKRTSGVWITSVCIAWVWLMCGLWVLVAYLHLPFYPLIPFAVWFGFFLIFSLFTSLSVVWTLTRPGPGDGDRTRTRTRVDRSKQKAFHTIVVIMAALIVRFAAFLVCFFMFGFTIYGDPRYCLAIKMTFWFCLPSSLVLPLLFLQRNRKPARH